MYCIRIVVNIYWFFNGLYLKWLILGGFENSNVSCLKNF